MSWADPGWEVAVAAGAELGERPFWDPADGCLLWVDINAGRLHRYRPGAGDEVVLLGDQQGLRITAEDWASRLDTISYEIVCGIGPRVPRVYVGGP